MLGARSARARRTPMMSDERHPNLTQREREVVLAIADHGGQRKQAAPRKRLPAAKE